MLNLKRTGTQMAISVGMSWSILLSLHLIVTSLTFGTAVASTDSRNISKCVKILSPYIDIAFAVSVTPLGLDEAYETTKGHRDYIFTSEQLKFTGIRVLRQGEYLGHLAFFKNKGVLLQDPLSREEAEILNKHSDSFHTLPFFGYVMDSQGSPRPIRPLIPGLGLLPAYTELNVTKKPRFQASQYQPRFTLSQIFTFEHLLQKLQEQINVSVFPETSKENEDIIFQQVLSTAKFVFQRDAIYLERVDFNWLLEHNNQGFHIGRVDGKLNPLLWTNWLRAYLIRNMSPAHFDIYRAFLWKVYPVTALNLDFFETLLKELGGDSKFIPPLSQSNFNQIGAVTQNAIFDKRSPHPRPENLKFDTKRLNYHFKKHAALTGTSSKEEYAMKAIRFISRDPRPGRIYQVRKSGDIALFSYFTDEFAVFTADGLIRTYYKPESSMHGLQMNAAYFMKDLYEEWAQDSQIEVVMEDDQAIVLVPLKKLRDD